MHSFVFEGKLTLCSFPIEVLFMPSRPVVCVLHTQSCLTLVTPWTVAHQAPLSTGFSRQEYWSGCHFLLQCMKVKSESEGVQSCPTLATPWTADHQAPLSTGFSRQEYWSGVLFCGTRYGYQGLPWWLTSILVWRIPRTEELGRLQSMGSQESDTTEQLSTAQI